MQVVEITKKTTDEKLLMMVEQAYSDISSIKNVEPADVLRRVREMASVALGLQSIFFSGTEDKEDFMFKLSSMTETQMKRFLEENRFNFFFEGKECNPVQRSLFV